MLEWYNTNMLDGWHRKTNIEVYAKINVCLFYTQVHDILCQNTQKRNLPTKQISTMMFPDSNKNQKCSK